MHQTLSGHGTSCSTSLTETGELNPDNQKRCIDFMIKAESNNPLYNR